MSSESCPACVLLIEDDARLGQSLGAFFESRGYPTVLAEDGDRAFELLGMLQRPCLVLVDLLTLHVDCVRLLASLGPEDRIATLPMVLVAVGAPELLSRPAVVKKPADFEILFRVVQEHCCGGTRAGGKGAAEPRSL